METFECQSDNHEIDCKRFYLDIKIPVKCAHCGADIELDLNRDYIDYPVPNKESKMHVYCSDCDEESYFPYKLRISIEAEIDKMEKY